MLTASRKQLIEKVIAKGGILYRVTFAVSFEFGQVKAEVIKAIPLGNLEENSEILSLPEYKKESVTVSVLAKVFFDSFVSTYSNLIFLNGSKPRAPTV